MNDAPKYKYIPPLSWHIFTPIYDFLCIVLGFGKGFKKRILGLVHLQEGFSVADIGCGTGVFLEVAKKQYPKVNFIGIDPDSDALKIAEHRLSKSGLHVALYKAFAEALPLTDTSIDVAYSTLAFHHMPDKVKYRAIEEMYRVLKTGGIIVITDFGENKGLYFWLAHILSKHAYTKGNLQRLIPQYIDKIGFRNCEILENSISGIKNIKAQK